MNNEQESVDSIEIPSQPSVFEDISEELKKAKPDFKEIIDIIKTDKVLSEQVIKTANSPFFGLRAADSVDRALSSLSFRVFSQIVMVSNLKTALKGKGPLIGRFWEHSMLVARSTRYLYIRKRRSELLASGAK
ncbi:MAG: HDOD domain-containing protein [Nitrospirae bacterium]|nr:HDOD domain-containing protein [Nitrospirota bacterium]MBF0536172.1 HDOD domain-containing protein [Nitrospirota bacterium]MBF0618203.1 HDOD domain-containing protein [Nitrospirota bacterium]